MFLAEVVLLSFLLVSGVRAQSEMAQCMSGYDWNCNSLRQDPCTVGSTLDASCRGLALYYYPPLNSNQYYIPPRVDHSGDLECDCNTVMYNLYMACASCQGGQIYSWTTWTASCMSVYISQYPGSIPQGITVPRWAFFNITVNILPSIDVLMLRLDTESSVSQMYDQLTMINIGREPEEMPSSGSTSLILSSTSPPVPTSNSSSDTGGGTNRVGAIVGGVLGSVVLLVILAVAVFFYTRYRRQQQVQPQLKDGLDPDKQRPSMHGPPITFGPFTSDNPSDPLTLPPQNPSDPLTFPPQNPSDSAFTQNPFDPPTPPPQNPSDPRRSLWVHKLKW